jgi:hypothetical protein
MSTHFSLVSKSKKVNLGPVAIGPCSSIEEKKRRREKGWTG